MPSNSCPSSIAEVAAERLWQFQLRKENKTILERLEENERRKDSMYHENEQKLKAGEEKLKMLEARISELEREHMSNAQAFETFKVEQISQALEIKKQLKSIIQNHHNVTEDGSQKNSKKEPCLAPGSHINGQSIRANENSKNTRSRKKQARKLQSIVDNQDQPPSLSEARPPEGNSISRSKEAPVTRHPNTRSHIKILQHPLHGAITSMALPKLNQGTGQLKHYFDDASSMLSLVSSPTEQFEIDFVNTFIRGVTSPKIREKLVGQLQQTHPSKQKKDGRVEILCGWLELGEAIKKTNLFAERNNGGLCKKK